MRRRSMENRFHYHMQQPPKATRGTRPGAYPLRKQPCMPLSGAQDVNLVTIIDYRVSFPQISLPSSLLNASTVPPSLRLTNEAVRRKAALSTALLSGTAHMLHFGHKPLRCQSPCWKEASLKNQITKSPKQ